MPVKVKRESLPIASLHQLNDKVDNVNKRLVEAGLKALHGRLKAIRPDKTSPLIEGRLLKTATYPAYLEPLVQLARDHERSVLESVWSGEETAEEKTAGEGFLRTEALLRRYPEAVKSDSMHGQMLKSMHRDAEESLRKAQDVAGTVRRELMKAVEATLEGARDAGVIHGFSWDYLYKVVLDKPVD